MLSNRRSSWIASYGHAHALAGYRSSRGRMLGIGRSPKKSPRMSIRRPTTKRSWMDLPYTWRTSINAQESVGLPIVERVMAGDVPSQSVARGTTAQVMTGAPIPDGAQAMVMVEDTDVRENQMYYRGGDVKAGQGIMRRATTFAKDDVVLNRGKVIRPIEIGLLCEVGRDHVRCVRPPRVAILPTGEELVPVAEKPGPGQIRNSNGPMLHALAVASGCEATLLDVARDDEESLRARIAVGLESDVLVLSGGVSAGVRDLVPSTLESLGVKCVFHKVAIKPGKPIWFGVYEQPSHRTMVFGLPGNPVSSMVCFELFVKSAIRSLCHRSRTIPWKSVWLDSEFRARGNRPTLWPGSRSHDGGRCFVTPLPWRGSGDMLTVTQADCLIYFEVSPKSYHAGEEIRVIELL